ncbi:MAG: T9SS type A sorting domain-containing protein, partial [Gemmatimonadetes bacterium]|nr:T9SS type A sorting domain-containing protein [Gemmatimonadota bacterium]
AGDLDGDLSVAQLRYPVGINATQDGSLFYVSDLGPAGRGRLRRIYLTPTGAPVLAPGNAGLSLSPNPFRAMTSVRYALRRNGPTDLAVYDTAGRLVRRLADAPGVAGEHVVTWDGRDDSGRPTAAGVYHLRLSADGRTEGRRVVRLR